MSIRRWTTSPPSSCKRDLKDDVTLRDYDDLFVASGLVFSTGGWANPTPTIVALALRLG